jgi:hypothetical protein
MYFPYMVSLDLNNQHEKMEEDFVDCCGAMNVVVHHDCGM